MTDILCPILELCAVIPGLLLTYLPVSSYLRQPLKKILIWLVPLLLFLSAALGSLCYKRCLSTMPAFAFLVLSAAAVYVKSLRISLWKSGSVALSVCAVFSCLKSLSRAVNAAILIDMHLTENQPWFCLRAVICYNALCWLFVLLAYYPATHTVQRMVEDENFAQTWYVFWILPLVFIALNLFMIPRYQSTLYIGRVLQGYIVISAALLILLLWFNAVFLMMADSLNRNARLQQENQFLSMQQQRYENLKTSIKEAQQARHDMRHHLNQLSVLADEGDLQKLRIYLTETTSRIAVLDTGLCENRAADSVISYYCALAKQNSIPFITQLDLPAQIPVNEMDMCLVLSNLLENALEASLRISPSLRHIKLTAYLHGKNLLLIQVENAFDGIINKKNDAFQSSKRIGSGIGTQSIRHIAEKSGGASTFSYQDGIFYARIMLRAQQADH